MAAAAGIDGLRVALVHDWLTGMRGGEKCLEVLCEVLPRADIYTLVHERGSVSPTIESHRIRESFLGRLPGGRRLYRWLVPLYPMAVESFDLAAYDLVVSVSTCAAKGAVTRADTLHVCYCNTPVRYFWDLYGAYFGPGRGSWLARVAAPFVAHPFRLWDRVSADRVDLFVANSANVAARIAKHYRRRSRIVHPPVDTSFFTPGREPAASRDASYLLVSALVPYKGIDVAIRLFNRLRRPLRIVGSGPQAKRLRAQAGPTIRFEDWVSAEVLREAYRSCRALLQPHEEDFGIAPLEAMACGRPVVALRRGGAAEAVTAETGVLYDDPSEAGLEAALTEFERATFDVGSLRDRAVRFDRARYREAMERLIEEAWSAFARGRGSAEATRRPVGVSREEDLVV